MIKLHTPKPQYIVDMHHELLKPFSDEIYDWANNDVEAWLPDGDGDVYITSIATSTRKWMNIIWNSLSDVVKENILNHTHEIYIHISQ